MAFDIYQTITDRIIAQLENGVISWRKPWRGNPAINFVTRKPYQGINRLLLPDGGEWLTFKQAHDAGGSIKRGEKSSMVVFYKPLTIKDKDGNETDDEKTIPFLRYSNVFHISQTEGIETKLPPIIQDDSIKPIENAEHILSDYIHKSGVTLNIKPGSDRAYYTPSNDSITLPAIGQFDKSEEYYSTYFHEAVHSTGHEKRLNRKVGVSAFGSQTYSKEELIAEIGSAMLLNETGLEIAETFENNAAYIASWLKKLHDDKKLIVMAAGQAQKAADYITGANHTDSDTEE